MWQARHPAVSVVSQRDPALFSVRYLRLALFIIIDLPLIPKWINSNVIA